MKRGLTAVILLVAAFFISPVISEYEAPPYDPTAMVFLPPDAPRNMLPYVHREVMPHLKFIPTEMDQDINALINNTADYITWETMFTEDFLQGLKREMEWIEERYQKDFIDS
jgi:hypothetical protein